MPQAPQIRFNQPITVPYDSPVGFIVATGSSQARVNVYSDDGEFLSDVDIEMHPPEPSIMTINSGGRTVHVFKTNIPGIGIIYPDQISQANVVHFSAISPQQFTHGDVSFNLRYQLIKTSNSYQSGTLTGNYGDFYRVCRTIEPSGTGFDQTAPIPFGTSLTVSGNPVVIDPPCKVTTSNINVPMGTIPLSHFTHTGSVIAPMPFNISMTCDATADVSFSITPSVSGGINLDQGIINLDAPDSNATAKGVGLQILFNSMPLKLNEVIKAGKTQGKNFDIPLLAQYIQTTDKVTAGDANASATFIISYN
ncbi:MAG: fimbrial protein [Scandinavium sp.]|uniref:fimbrial protein n=1 Tax=Scandinavium sp. TaxID=2830653 RepID=UPI003F3DB87A